MNQPEQSTETRPMIPLYRSVSEDRFYFCDEEGTPYVATIEGDPVGQLPVDAQRLVPENMSADAEQARAALAEARRVPEDVKERAALIIDRYEWSRITDGSLGEQLADKLAAAGLLAAHREPSQDGEETIAEIVHLRALVDRLRQQLRDRCSRPHVADPDAIREFALDAARRAQPDAYEITATSTVWMCGHGAYQIRAMGRPGVLATFAANGPEEAAKIGELLNAAAAHRAQPEGERIEPGHSIGEMARDLQEISENYHHRTWNDTAGHLISLGWRKPALSAPSHPEEH